MRKRVLVTGGARGIGRAIVEELAGGDYEILATYFQSKEEADTLVKKFPNVRFMELDLRDRSSLDTFIRDVSGEEIDVLVNNAGLWIGRPFEKMSQHEIFEQVDLNFAAPTQMIHGLLPVLKKGNAPLVVSISSHAAHPTFPGEAVYSAVKAALSTLSQVLRMELNSTGVRVTTFEPMGVNTYGVTEPSNMVLPQELAKLVRYVIEMPGHLQLDTVGMSHINQVRGEYPEWIEK